FLLLQTSNLLLYKTAQTPSCRLFAPFITNQF
ncbi:MAG: hypothetical protein ACI892_002325, partial [Marinobacter maritimus]